MRQYSLNNQTTPQPRKKKIIIVAGVILAVILAVALALWLFRPKAKAPEQAQEQATEVTEVTEPAAPELPDLQPTVDAWITQNPGVYAVKITDTSGKVLAVTNGDKQFFTASIYKLFVAYVGYQKIDDGTYKLTDPYLAGYTRGKCLDAMIRDSYSPCAEKMWVELGKDSITQKMKDYGLTNTSLTGLTTTANDTAIILANIEAGKDLSAQSRAAYLDSLKTQDAKYRRGLPSGFTNATVYNKVGWNLDQEWHDAAIVELKNGQKVIVSVMTDGVGYEAVAGLGEALEAKLQ
jgi:beta-lactamase class A